MSTTARLLLGSTLVGLAVVGGAMVWLWPVIVMLQDPARIGRNYFIPAESMLPTLAIGDRVRPLRPTAARLTRGAVIIFQAADSVRVARIVGVGGDVVAMKSGHLTINAVPVRLVQGGSGPRLSDGSTTRLQLERLPREPREHRLLDAGDSPGDEVPNSTVPAGHVYVLGDNRDRAADSRYPRDQMGVGFVPIGKVIGVVDRVLWSASFGDRGRPIEQPAP